MQAAYKVGTIIRHTQDGDQMISRMLMNTCMWCALVLVLYWLDPIFALLMHYITMRFCFLLFLNWNYLHENHKSVKKQLQDAWA